VGEALTTVEEAVAALVRGGVVVIPTDTVYGLAAKADNAEAVERIYELKGRPREKALQLLVPDLTWLDRFGHPSAAARTLAERFWPGPLTIVVPGDAGDTVGLRMPDHPLALEVLKVAGAVAATSANRSGEQTPRDLGSIREVFADAVDVYLDGGVIDGTASTVVDMTGAEPLVLREGALTVDEITRALGGRFEAE
jgi:L-threonylcarbamoyladenylate synthase